MDQWDSGICPAQGGKTRDVPLSPRLLGRLDAYSEEFEPVEVTLPWLEPHGKRVTVRLLIPPAERTLPARSTTNPSNVVDGAKFTTNVWTPAFADTGLTYVPGHDKMHVLRHFYASHLQAAGCSIKEVAEFLGHADPGFTLRMYTHLVPTSHERARAACDLLFPDDGSGEEEAA